MDASGSFPFDLVDSFPDLRAGCVGDAVTDDGLRWFGESYRAYRIEADAALSPVLRSSQTPFRGVVPYDGRSFVVAKQLFWYFDQLIVRDPVFSLLAEQPRDLEDVRRRKAELCQLLGVMRHLRPAIDSGYIVLTALQTEPPAESGVDDLAVARLLEQDEVVTALSAAVSYRLGDVRPIPGGDVRPYRAGLRWNFIAGGRVRTRHAGPFSLPISPFEDLPPVEPAEGLVVERAASPESEDRFAAVRAFNASLPFVEGVSPEVLVRLRHELPDSFQAFRGRMLHGVREASLAGSERGLRSLERELSEMNRSLSAEMTAIVRKLKVGLGAPALVSAVAGIGVFLSSPASVPIATLLGASTLAAGVQLSDYAAASARARANPAYFIWKAGRMARPG